MKKKSTLRIRPSTTPNSVTPQDDLPDFGTGEEFDALSDADKVRVAKSSVSIFERRESPLGAEALPDHQASGIVHVEDLDGDLAATGLSDE